MNKQVLTEKLNMTYSWIERMLSQISEDEMTQSIISGERTPKDILAHIAAWNWNGIEWIKSVAAGEKPLLPMDGHNLEERDTIFAGLNEEIHSRNQSKSLKEVIDDYHQSWAILMTLVETLKQEDLDRTIHLEWALNPFQAWTVVAWRIQHAENHGKHIEGWLEKKS
ncbi:MAG: ClbS/DfsB family four-helix bundle protein [Candidatus Thorarchaeota archaeon]